MNSHRNNETAVLYYVRNQNDRKNKKQTSDCNRDHFKVTPILDKWIWQLSMRGRPARSNLRIQSFLALNASFFQGIHLTFLQQHEWRLFMCVRGRNIYMYLDDSRRTKCDRGVGKYFFCSYTVTPHCWTLSTVMNKPSWKNDFWNDKKICDIGERDITVNYYVLYVGAVCTFGQFRCFLDFCKLTAWTTFITTKEEVLFFLRLLF